MDGFTGTLDTCWVDNLLMMEGIASTFKGKLDKMTKDTGGKFDDYSISPKFRQILLYRGYELTKKIFFCLLTQQLMYKNELLPI